MASVEADSPDYPRCKASFEKQPGRHTSVVDPEENNIQLPAKIPFYRRREGVIIIILLIAIVVGVVVGGAVGGTELSTLTAQRDSALGNPTTIESLGVITTTMAPNSSILSTSSSTVTSTISAQSPTPSNCVWEGTAPFCDGKCHTGFTQTKEDNCGNGDCCFTGFKVYCCQG